MFSKLKQVRELRSQAKTIQNALAAESVTVEKNGIKIVMNGNLEITSIEIAEVQDKDRLAGNMKNLANDAIKQVQKIMAKKMQEMGGLPGLS